MRRVIKIFLLLLLSPFCKAQNNTIDSLKKLLQIDKQDTGRVMQLYQLSKSYLYLNPDTTLLLAQQSLSLSNIIGFAKGKALSMNLIANVFTTTGNYLKALQLHLKALKIAEASQDKRIIAYILGSISTDYSFMGDYRRAIGYNLKALVIFKAINNLPGVGITAINLGDSYEKLNMLDSALIYTSRAYDLALQQKDIQLTGIALVNLGNIYLKMGQPGLAMSKYRLSIPFVLEINDPEFFSEIYLGMARVFQKAGSSDSSLYYAKLSLAFAQKVGFTISAINASNFLTAYYMGIHNVDSAFVYQNISMTVKDSLFSQEKQNAIQGLSFDETMRQQELQDAKEEAQTQLKFNILFGGLFILFAVAFILYRNNRQKQKANFSLTQQKLKVESTLQELKLTQAQLVQTEKMASLGELTAGIAHEIQNPLNFVNNFSEVNTELIEEMKTELKAGNNEDAIAIANDIASNEQKINHHGKRADAIVKGMLQHSRSSSGVKEPTDINALADEYLRLAYHGLRAKDKSFNATMNTDFETGLEKINIISQDIGRVILNLFTNAFYSVSAKRKALPPQEGGIKNPQDQYEPTVSVSTKRLADKVVIRVKDNGMGVPQKVLDKIFQPFFTTKPVGEGTGLGLSISYDIIKAHGGELKVETKEGEGAEFIIILNV